MEAHYINDNVMYKSVMYVGGVNLLFDVILAILFLISRFKSNSMVELQQSKQPEKLRLFSYFNMDLKQDDCILITPTDIFRRENTFQYLFVLFVGPVLTLGYSVVAFKDRQSFIVINSNEVLDFVLLNFDPLCSMCAALIYLLHFGRVVRIACLFLSQATPSYINVAKCKQEIENLVMAAT
jgi:Co/Zn/Cd efflux system component